MSIRIMTLVWDDKRIGRRDLLVALALADHADDNGRCYPSIDRIAAKARLSRRTTIDVLQRLETAGLIRIDRSAGPNGVNVYTVGGAKSAPVQNLHPCETDASSSHTNRKEPSNDKKNAREAVCGKPDSIDEVRSYASRLIPDGEQHVDAFFDHFTANGWRTGTGTGKPIKDWQAAFRSWCRRAPQFAPKGATSTPMTYAEMVAHATKHKLVAGKEGHYRYLGKSADQKQTLWLPA